LGLEEYIEDLDVFGDGENFILSEVGGSRIHYDYSNLN
jgi:hypothetical protein